MAKKPFTVQKAQESEPMEVGFSLPITFFSSAEVAPDWETGDRDAYLRSFWKRFGNDMVQAVLAVSVAKVQTQNWEIEGPEGLVDLYHPILRDDTNFHRGYGDLIARGVQDYYTQDNGWFMERQRSGPKDFSGPMLGLAHLDSARMFPTGNQDFPYMYHDVEGAHHLMHRSQLIRIVDMPDPATELRGWDRGFCALSRALSTAIILMMLVTLKREKLSDLPPSALAIFNNLNRKQFEKAIAVYGSQEDMKNNTIWRSLMPLFGIDPAHPAAVQFLSLREVWESFDDMTAMNIAAYSFAAAWRIDPREFWPVSQGPLGTGKEAEVQHQKAKAKSTGLLFTELERAFNATDSLPKGLTFKYVLQDADEEQQRALIHQLQIGNIKTMQEAGAGLVPDEIRYLLATQYKVIPQIMAKAPGEGEVVDLTHADVYLDDVERQAKALGGWYWGPCVRMDQNGKKVRVNRLGYKLPTGVMFLGEKGGAESQEVVVEDEYVEELNDNLALGSKEALLGCLKEQFACCESHAFDLFPDIVRDLHSLNYLTLEQMCKASIAPAGWVYDVSQAIRPLILGVKGGPGSGNWGHAGRPGLVGGSGGRGGAIATGVVADWARPPKLNNEVVAELSKRGPGDVQSVAEELGLHYDLSAFSRVNRRWTQQADADAKEEIHGWLTSGAGVRELTLYNDWSSDVVDAARKGAQFPSFKEWLDTPQMYYRGGGRSDIFMSFAHSERVALDASKAANVFAMTLKPSQLLGSGMTGAGEVYVDSDMLDYVKPATKELNDNLVLVAKEIVDRLDRSDFRLGEKESRGLQTINQKIAALPAPTARTVRENAKTLNTTFQRMGTRARKRLLDISDEEWNEWVATDELEQQQEQL